MSELKVRGVDDIQIAVAACISCAIGSPLPARASVVSAFIATAFVQDDALAAGPQWRKVVDQLRSKLLKLPALMVEAEQYVPPT